MDSNQNIEFFRELITCNQDLYSWIFDASGKIIFSNCPYELSLNTLFTIYNCKDFMINSSQEIDGPLVLSSPIGLIWITIYKKNEAVFHTIGPAFFMDVSHKSIVNSLSSLDLSISLQNELIALLESLPTLTSTLLQQYALMLHYCVTGIKAKPSDILYQNKQENNSVQTKSEIESDRLRQWRTEQEILRMVSEGNLNYKNILASNEPVSKLIQINIDDSLRKAKDITIIFTSLCVRAAIEGGLSPDIAYGVGEYYIQAIETSKLVTDLGYINNNMYEDFIKRVYKSRANADYSATVQGCCDYISAHLEEKLSIEAIALRLGYSKYYLTRKFQSETGVSLGTYIKTVKIERAKQLFCTTDLSIQNICDALNFSSRSYFADTFQKMTGMSPGKFRELNRKL